MKHFDLVHTKFSFFQAYVERLKEKVAREPSIEWVPVYGSATREEWNEQSDNGYFDACLGADISSSPGNDPAEVKKELGLWNWNRGGG